MRKRRLPVGPTIIAAYRDLARLLSAMPALMGSAFVIILASSAGAELVPQRLWDQQLSSEALGLAQNAVEALLLTPVVIAIHRFVILDKITRNYTLPIGEGVFGVFFGWLFALKVLIGLPMDILGLLETLSRSIWTVLLGFAVAAIAVATLVLRLLILLPALAVGAPGAVASRAWADSKGHVLRILAVILWHCCRGLPSASAALWYWFAAR